MRTSSASRARPIISSATGCARRRSADLLAEGPLPLDAALVATADAADAVAHAHARHDLTPGGILHLGLSPETVLVDGEGSVLVRDFGLLTARVAPGWADDDCLV